jgi:hypothetical protein
MPGLARRNFCHPIVTFPEHEIGYAPVFLFPMKTALCFLLLILPGMAGALVASEIVVKSPDKAKTWAHGSIDSRKLVWKKEQKKLYAVVTFSNAQYAGMGEAAERETFEFSLPGIIYDSAARRFYASDTKGRPVAVAEMKKEFLGQSIQPLPHTLVRVIRLKGNVEVILEANTPTVLNLPATGGTNGTYTVPLDAVLRQ